MGRTGWDHARFARVIPAGKKQQGAALHPLGPQGPRPREWAHRIQDRTQPGQLPFYFPGGFGGGAPMLFFFPFFSFPPCCARNAGSRAGLNLFL